MQAALRKRTTAGFIVVIVVVAVTGAIAFVNAQQFRNVGREVERTLEIVYELEAVRFLMVNAETGQRGYLITGEESYLEPYRDAVELIDGRLARARALIADRPELLEQLSALADLIRQRLALLEDIIVVRRVDGFEAAQAMVLEGRGKQLMDEGRAQIDAIEAGVNSRLAAQRAAAEAAARGALLTFVVLTLVAGGMLLLVYASITRDVVGRQRAELALQQANDALRDLYDNAPCGYHSLDRNGVYQRVNHTELAWLGYSAAELIGRRTFADLLTDESKKTFAANFPRFLAEGQVHDLEFDMVRKDGSLIHVLLHATAVRDDAGEYVHSRSTIFDISDRRRAEERIRALHIDLERRARDLTVANEEMEAFSYSVSHDLRAPLRSIDGFSQVLLEDYGDQLDAEARAVLDRVRAASQRMALLIDDLLNLSRMSRAEMAYEHVDLSKIARSIAAALQAQQPERDVAFVIAEGITAHGDARLLRVLLDNLLGNAWKFTAKTAHARIEFTTTTTPDAAGTVYVVRDNGAGFDMAYVDKLFGAFQRLHSMTEFEGTGIGLATVRRIAQRHGGRVWAEGAVKQGAAFYFTLEDRSPQPAPTNSTATSSS